MRRNMVSDMERYFIINLGTTSFKCKLFAFADGQAPRVLAEGEAQSIGADLSAYVFRCGGELAASADQCLKTHADAFELFLTLLSENGILRNLGALTAVGYKAVHGGRFCGTCLVSRELLEEMERVAPLAPAHNPVYISAMRALQKRYPKLLQIARFETSFHSTVPEYRRVYGVPYEWRERFGIQKYGFHGSSHQYIAQRMGELDPDARRVISCHLGGSSSVCGIQDGKSVGTTMGATPQGGLFNNNRVGEFDCFCLPVLQKHYGGDLERVFQILSAQSGFLGISGVSNDLRRIFDAMDAGDPRARLAVEAFVDSIVGYVGMYTAYLGGLDALVFTGGIGTNSGRLRRMVCEKLSFLGITLSESEDSVRKDACLSPGWTTPRVWCVQTNEELVVARCVHEFVHSREYAAGKCVPDVPADGVK